MKGILVYFLAFWALQAVLGAEPLKRRKLRRKVIKSAMPQMDELEDTEENRDGRGYVTTQTT